VFNTGSGFPEGFSLDQPSERHGLRNVRDRLRAYYGEAAKLCWEGNADGTRVKLILPRTAASQPIAMEEMIDHARVDR